VFTLSSVNTNGNTATLTPFETANVAAVKHGVWSERLREPRARELFEELMQAPHVTELDAVGAVQIARLEALIESCEDAVSRNGVMKARAAADIMLRAIRRQTELLDRYGLTPRGRLSGRRR
jgi:hypothetical protein